MSRARDVRSIAAMYLLHGLNIGLPLITIPFLTRSLGAEQYGVYGLIVSWIAISTILIDFGYGIRGTKRMVAAQEVSAGGETPKPMRDDMRLGLDSDSAPDYAPDYAADSVAGQVVLYQSLHALLVLPALAAAVLLSLRGASPGGLSLALLLASALLTGVSPLWFHVARASVARLLAPTLAAKLLSLALTVLALPLFPSLELALAAHLAANLWVLADLNRRSGALKTQWQRLRRDAFAAELRASAAIPLQRLGTMLYTYLPTAVAATWFGLAAAGWYFLADRIVRGVIGLFTPLTAHLLPVQLAAGRDGARVAPMIAAVLLLSLLASALLALLAGPICVLLGGPAFAPAAEMLAWLAPLVVLVTANAILLNRLYAADAEGAIAWVIWGCGLGYLGVLFAVGRVSPAVFAALSTGVEAAALACFIALSRRRRRAAG